MNNNKSIQETEEEIIEAFSLFDTWEEKYEYIIDLGKKLPALDEKYKVEENIIKGCQSTVWLASDYNDAKVFFKADSDAVIVKGLVSMLITVLSGHTPDEILNAKLDFIREIGMMTHLAQTRSNGLLSMIKQIKNYALVYKSIKTPEKQYKMDEATLKQKVIDCLQTIYDPEIPVSIYELGLVYEVEILPINNVQIVMTLTAPSCPSAQEIPIEVDQKVRMIEGVNDVHVSVVWNPPWDRSMMSEVAMLELGFI